MTTMNVYFFGFIYKKLFSDKQSYRKVTAEGLWTNHIVDILVIISAMLGW